MKYYYWLVFVIFGLGIALSVIGDKSGLFYPLLYFAIGLIIIAIVLLIKMLIKKKRK